MGKKGFVFYCFSGFLTFVISSLKKFQGQIIIQFFPYEKKCFGFYGRRDCDADGLSNMLSGCALTFPVNFQKKLNK
jgi:hypothetical protein